VGFLTGFVAVLCIGNYYCAQRAMERQKHRRLARLSGHAGNGVIGVDSTSSHASATSSQMSDEHKLLGSRAMHQNATRRRNMEDQTELLLDVNDTRPRAHISNI
jgi:hypothetical protein